MRKTLKRTGIALAVVAGLYAGLTAVLFAVMYQPPARIASVFNHVPWPFWVVLPMRPLWLHARQGALRVGDPAPEFDLATWDKTSRVRLSAQRGKPVVLVFGSYT